MQISDVTDFIVCANLDRRPDRWDFMRSQFAREGMESMVHRVSAVDGSKGLPLLNKYHPSDNTFTPPEVVWSAGQAGRAVTFTNALMMAEFVEARAMLYLEDDALLPPGFLKRLMHAFKSIPPDWDIANLGAWNVEPTTPANLFWNRLVMPINHHAVIVRQSAYRSVIELMRVHKTTGDIAMGTLSSLLEIYGPRELAIPQVQGWSDVANRNYTEREGRVSIDSVGGDPNLVQSFFPGVLVRNDCYDSDLTIVDEVIHNDAYGVRRAAELPKGVGPLLRVLDLGAHIGTFACMVHEHHPRAVCVCVEPDPANHPCLMKNVGRLDRVHVIEEACAYGHDEVTIIQSVPPQGDEKSVAWSAYSRVREHSIDHDVEPTFPTVRVPTCTVEDVADRMGWPVIDMLKMDVEGSEWNILDHMDLDRVKCVVMEWHGREEWQRRVDPGGRLEGWEFEEFWDAGKVGMVRLVNRPLIRRLRVEGEPEPKHAGDLRTITERVRPVEG